MRNPANFDTARFGGQTCVRSGWFWVPATPGAIDDLEQAALADVAEARRDRIGWILTFALAGLAALAAIVREALA